MNRREFITLLGATVVWRPQPLRAQPHDKTYRVAVLSTAAETMAAFREVVLPELAKDGFVEGGNLSISGYFGEPGEMPKLTQEVLAFRPDVVVASSLVSVQAMRTASPSIPIVMSYLGEDPVEQGLAQSLGRPGTNVTGLVLMATRTGRQARSALAGVVALCASSGDPGTKPAEKPRPSRQDAACGRGARVRGAGIPCRHLEQVCRSVRRHAQSRQRGPGYDRPHRIFSRRQEVGRSGGAGAYSHHRSLGGNGPGRVRVRAWPQLPCPASSNRRFCQPYSSRGITR